MDLTFSATWGEDSPTRTSLQDHGAVYWNPGDAINIFYGKSMTGRFESTLTEAAPVTNFQGSLSVGTETFDDDEDGDLTFWGVYPYDEDASFDGEGVIIDLPGVQTAAPYTFSGNLNPAIAVSDGMELSFYNVGGLFCFSVSEEGYYAASLRGNDGESLAGTLHVVVNESGVPEVDQVANGITSIYLDVPDGGTFEPGTLYYFVVIPQVLEQGITLSLYKQGETGEVTRTVPVNIRRSKIVRILNADKDNTYTVVGGQFSLTATGATPITLADGTTAYEVVFEGANADEATIGFESYKTVDGTSYPVAVHVSGYATDENGAPGTFGETVPEGFDGLVLETVADNWVGIAGVPARTDGETTAYDAVAVHAANMVAKGDNGFSAGAPQDLSLYDIADLATPRASGLHVTANCYVVDRAGWYMFPIVYGNAVDGTRPGNVNGCNVSAYDDGSGLKNPEFRYVMHTFQRGDGALIGSPYILSDMGLTASDVEAVIVWEDVDASTPLVQPGDVDVISGQGGFQAPDGSAVNVPYVKFRVDGDNIRPGNVVIAVRRRSDATILWSWHIWVTDADMTPIRTYSRSTVVPFNDMLRYNLGWCESTAGDAVSYPAQAFYVKVSQTEGDADPVIIKVTRAESAVTAAPTGSGTYYQFGRKDPFLPAENETNKTAFSPAGYTITDGIAGVPYSTTPSTTAASAIQNPHIFYAADDTGGRMWIRSSGTSSGQYVDFWNLWNIFDQTNAPAPATDQTGTGKDIKVTKTVYDPCPPGYCVPNYEAFTFVSVTGVNFESYADFNAVDRNGDGEITETDFENGWYFYTTNGPDKQETIFIPSTGIRDVESGLAMSPRAGLYRTAKAKGTRYAVAFTIGGGPYGKCANKGAGFAVRPVAE